AVKRARRVVRGQRRRDRVGWDGRRRGHVVVVAAVLVVGDEQRGVLPCRRAHQRSRYLGDVPLAHLDVLRVLLRGRLVVRIQERELGELAGGDVGQEPVEGV